MTRRKVMSAKAGGTDIDQGGTARMATEAIGLIVRGGRNRVLQALVAKTNV
jgi:hypothetical protein